MDTIVQNMTVEADQDHILVQNQGRPNQKVNLDPNQEQTQDLVRVRVILIGLIGDTKIEKRAVVILDRHLNQNLDQDLPNVM